LKLTVTHLTNINVHPFIELEDLLLCLQELATGPYLESAESRSLLYTLFLTFILILSSNLRPDSTKKSLLLTFFYQNFVRVSHFLHVSPYIIIHDFITTIILSDVQKLHSNIAILIIPVQVCEFIIQLISCYRKHGQLGKKKVTVTGSDLDSEQCLAHVDLVQRHQRMPVKSNVTLSETRVKDYDL
jgi:hypothetical protein